MARQHVNCWCSFCAFREIEDVECRHVQHICEWVWAWAEVNCGNGRLCWSPWNSICQRSKWRMFIVHGAIYVLKVMKTVWYLTLEALSSFDKTWFVIHMTWSQELLPDRQTRLNDVPSCSYNLWSRTHRPTHSVKATIAQNCPAPTVSIPDTYNICAGGQNRPFQNDSKLASMK